MRTIANEYQAISDRLIKQINKETDKQIMGSSTVDLIDYYYHNNCLTAIELDSERDEFLEYVTQWEVVHAEDREGPFRIDGDLEIECTYLLIHIPIISPPDMYRILDFTSEGLFAPQQGYRIQWQTNTAIITIKIKGYRINFSEEEIVQNVKNIKQQFLTQTSHFQAILDEANEKLKRDIDGWILQRKKIIEENHARRESLLKKIDIPIKKKDDPAATRIKLHKSPVVQRLKPTPIQPEEYVINGHVVQDIVKILDNQGRQFEKTPKTYLKMEEEDLRNILLVNLNSVFEGSATGETFSGKGKTDIYLQIAKGNILVFECKFWGGAKMYQDTIDQLLGYLTWRMNYAVVIKFCKLKNFSKILGEVGSTVENHPSYRSGFRKLEDTHFISHHNLPNDDQKKVEIHHLFYNTYAE